MIHFIRSIFGSALITAAAGMPCGSDTIQWTRLLMDLKAFTRCMYGLDVDLRQRPPVLICYGDACWLGYEGRECHAFDRNWDYRVDLEDFANITASARPAHPRRPPALSTRIYAEFLKCMKGPGVKVYHPAVPCGERYDRDSDGDVDLRDFAKATGTERRR